MKKRVLTEEHHAVMLNVNSRPRLGDPMPPLNATFDRPLFEGIDFSSIDDNPATNGLTDGMDFNPVDVGTGVPTRPFVPRPAPPAAPLVQIAYDELPRGMVTEEHAILKQATLMQGRPQKAGMSAMWIEEIKQIRNDMKLKKRMVGEWAIAQIKDMMLTEAKHVGWEYWDSKKQNKLPVRSFANIGQAYADMSMLELELGGYRQMHGICYRIFVENGSFSNRMESEFMLANNWMYVGLKPPGNLGCVGHIITLKKYGVVRQAFTCCNKTHGMWLGIKRSASEVKTGNTLDGIPMSLTCRWWCTI